MTSGAGPVISPLQAADDYFDDTLAGPSPSLNAANETNLSPTTPRARSGRQLDKMSSEFKQLVRVLVQHPCRMQYSSTIKARLICSEHAWDAVGRILQDEERLFPLPDSHPQCYYSSAEIVAHAQRVKAHPEWENFQEWALQSIIKGVMSRPTSSPIIDESPTLFPHPVRNFAAPLFGDEKPFKCCDCSMTYTTIARLQNHKLSKHSGTFSHRIFHDESRQQSMPTAVESSRRSPNTRNPQHPTPRRIAPALPRTHQNLQQTHQGLRSPNFNRHAPHNGFAGTSALGTRAANDVSWPGQTLAQQPGGNRHAPQASRYPRADISNPFKINTAADESIIAMNVAEPWFACDGFF